MWFLEEGGAEVNGCLLLFSFFVFRQEAYSHSVESLLLDHHTWTCISKYHHFELFLLLKPGILLPNYHLGEEKGHCNSPYMFFSLANVVNTSVSLGCFCMCIVVLIMNSSRKLGRAEPLSVQNKT